MSKREVLMDEFVRSYERMAAEVERIVAQYPPEMRDELREHAQSVMHQRLQNMWEELRQRQSRLS